MKRSRAASVALALVALALALGACGDDDDEEATTNPAPAVEAPNGGGAPPSPGGLQLPPGIAECLADKGYEVEPSEIHSVPPQVLNECFSALHQGGAAP